MVLCVVMLITLLPFRYFENVFAAREERYQCDECGEWLPQDEFCSECTMHKDNDACGHFNHCPQCGGCNTLKDDFCDTCGLCSDCWENDSDHCDICGDEGNICGSCGLCDDCIEETHAHCVNGHCLGDVDACPVCGTDNDNVHCENCALICSVCDNCFFNDEDEFCFDCGMCKGCALELNYHCENCEEHKDDVCDTCGLCLDCALESGTHCPLCHECAEGEMCDEGGDHCRNCCEANGWECSECGACMEALGLEKCRYCGFCEECCRLYAELENCTCGEFCTEQPDFASHFCEKCGICFDVEEQCEFCGLCNDCCKDTACEFCGMCVKNPEYKNHYCKECSGCKLFKDYCDTCGLCKECCEKASACSANLCAKDADYKDHFCNSCHECFHDVKICLSCKENGVLRCADCCKEHDNSANAGSEKLHFIRQPKSVNCRVSDNQSDDDKDYFLNTVTFSAKASESDVSYQWYYRYTDDGYKWIKFEDEKNMGFDMVKGSATDTLTIVVPTDACYNPIAVRCVGTKENTTIRSNEAKVNASHYYNTYDADPVDFETHHVRTCVGDGCDAYLETSYAPHKFDSWITIKPATEDKTGIKRRRCSLCLYYEDEVIPVAHEHIWLTGFVPYDSKYHCYECLICSEKKNIVAHNFGTITVTKEPTENVKGKGTHKCLDCGYVEEVTIPKLAHTHDYLKYEETDWDDSMYGEFTEFYNSAGHWKYCLECMKFENGKFVDGAKYDIEDHVYSTPELWSRADDSLYWVETCEICGYKRYYEFEDPEEGSYYIYISQGKAYSSDDYRAIHEITYAVPGQKVYIKCDNADTPDGKIFRKWINSGNGDCDVTLDKDKLVNKNSFTMPDHEVAVLAETYKCSHEMSLNKFKEDNPGWYMEHHKWPTEDELFDYYRERDYSISLEPTCTVDGYECAIRCKVCDAIVDYEVGNKKAQGHVITIENAETSTCVSYGYSGDKKCSVCNQIVEKGVKLPKSDHKYGGKQIVKEPTATSVGYIGYICQVCGKVERTNVIPSTGGAFTLSWHGVSKTTLDAGASVTVNDEAVNMDFAKKYSGEVSIAVKDDINYADTLVISIDGGETWTRMKYTSKNTDGYYVFKLNMVCDTIVALARKGDVNFDGKVNSADALQVLRFDVQKVDFNGLQFIVADVNVDGSVNSADALQILRFDVGKTDFKW